ncbi:MAG: hypothetical protein QG670_1738 [Thermoproteota archaeon]|nr:hypothetical protein [Thermoproteota archaeon]
MSLNAIRLMQYVHAARKRYLKTLNELPWDEIIKDRGASFPSIRDILLHSLDVEDRLINYVIASKAETWVSEDFGKFSTMSGIQQRIEEVENKVEAYLAKLSKTELERKITLPWRRDSPMMLMIEDVLVQVSIENISHLGELIALMWQFDKQPPFLSWSAFLEQGS